VRGPRMRESATETEQHDEHGGEDTFEHGSLRFGAPRRGSLRGIRTDEVRSHMNQRTPRYASNRFHDMSKKVVSLSESNSSALLMFAVYRSVAFSPNV